MSEPSTSKQKNKKPRRPAKKKEEQSKQTEEQKANMFSNPFESDQSLGVFHLDKTVTEERPKNPKKIGTDKTWDGLPYKGPTYALKEEDPEHMQPQLKCDAKVKVFKTWDPEEMAEYQEVIQQIYNRTSICSKEQMQEDPQGRGWLIFLRWGDQYYTAPESVRRQKS